MRRQLLALLTMLAATAGVLFATAAPAAAGMNDCTGAYASAPGGAACFAANGDHIWIHDTRSDSASVIAYFQTDYGRTGSCTNSGGSGALEDCNFNMAEDGRVRIYIRVYDFSENVELAESAWSSYTNI